MTILYILLFSGMIPLFPAEHDIHVSVCDINFSGNEVEVVLKTFLDDLQLAIGLEPGQEVPEQYTSSDEMIHDYVVEKIQITIDGRPYKLLLEDISASMEAVWITFKIDDYLEVPSTFHIQSTFLTEVYSDQMNLVNFRFDNGTKSISLNHKKVKASYQLK